MALAWVAIFGAGFRSLHFSATIWCVAQRLPRRSDRHSVQQGAEIRIPMAIDGHFWVEGAINGVPVKFLVDSGATMTTIGRADAERAGVKTIGGRNQLVRTGNGVVRMSSARAERLSIGGIERTDVGMHVAENEDLNVLGMNFLSSLERWGVEGRWLILRP